MGKPRIVSRDEHARALWKYYTEHDPYWLELERKGKEMESKLAKVVDLMIALELN